MIKTNAETLVERMAKRYAALSKTAPKGLRVGVFNVPYASYHEFGTKWSNKMPYGFFKAVRDQKKRSPSKNVMQFAGTGRDRMARLKARPFYRPAVEQHRDRIINMLTGAVTEKPESFDRIFQRIGQILVTQMARNVRRPPNPEGGARGPIANTGNLLNSIRYEILR